MIHYRLCLVVGFSCTAISAFSQPLVSRRGPTLSVGGQVAIPRGEFAEFYKGYPTGINAAASFPIWGLPIEAGGGFAWNEIAGEGRQVYISDNYGGVDEAKLKIKGNAYTYNVHARLRPLNGGFRPYGEVLAGMANYSVKSKLYTGAADDRAAPETEVSNRDYTWITGWAVGLEVRLFPSVFLEGRFQKITGDRTEYINPRSIEIAPTGSYTFDTQTSRIDQFAVSLGLAFSF